MQEAILAAVLDAADDGIIVFDRDGRCVRAGRRISELFGVDHTSLIGQGQTEVLRLLAAACEEPEGLFGVAKGIAGSSGQAGEIELHRPRVRTARWQATAIFDEQGPAGWLGIFRDVTRERSAERRSNQLLQRLEQITATDALTQLPNRRRFLEELEREHGRAARAWDSYAVLRIDIDGLDAINSELGQPRGDEVLERVAERLRDGRREYDLLARLEADEFIVLLPSADVTAARVVAQRMETAVASTPIEVGVPRRVTVTIGAAVWVPPSGEIGPDVVRRAGEALKAAKSTAPGGVSIDDGYTPHVGPAAR